METVSASLAPRKVRGSSPRGTIIWITRPCAREVPYVKVDDIVRPCECNKYNRSDMNTEPPHAAEGNNDSASPAPQV